MGQRGGRKEMLERCRIVLKQPGDDVDVATLGSVVETATDGEIDGGVGRDNLAQRGEMIGCPDIIVAEIGNPCAARLTDADVVRGTLAAAVLRQVPPSDLWRMEGPHRMLSPDVAAVPDDQQLVVVERLS